MTTLEANHVALPAVPGARWWRAARRLGLTLTLALLAGLLLDPEFTLGLFWDVVIPLVPASLLVSPAIWRNVCPLGALNMMLNGLGRRRRPRRESFGLSTSVGMVLLGVLVPARRFVFNTDGPSLALTILAVGVAALVLGAVFDMKGGFCNAICPVLPVERLYGQSPLLEVGNPNCTPCTQCAPGCLDMAPRKSIATVLGLARRSRGWLVSPFGMFAGAFPGFVLGYNLLENGPWSSAGSVYLYVAAWTGGSYLVAASLVRALDLASAPAIRGMAGVAASIYYWFAAEVIAKRVGIAPSGTAPLRLLALALVGFWLWRAFQGAAERQPRAEQSHLAE